MTAIGARPRTLIPSDGDDRGFDLRLPYLTEKRRTHPLADWFAPLLPESRAAIFRTICYLFVIVDVHLIVRDPISLSRHPELYRPLLLASDAERAADHCPIPRRARRLLGGSGQSPAASRRLSGRRRLHLVDGDRHELWQGRP